MRDHLVFYLNGRRQTVHGRDALLTLSTFLRDRRRLVGTKIVCSEGDCGACAVLLGRPIPGENRLEYHAIDACIAFLYQLDGTHIITIEGLGRPDALSPVQQAMVQCHGSQCGYCTPGIVTTLHGHFDRCSGGDHEGCGRADMPAVLSGNLCRCTGYVQIFDAAMQVERDELPRLSQTYPDGPMLEDFAPLRDDMLALHTHDDSQADRIVYAPTTLGQAIDMKAQHPAATLVSGATDVGVWHNHDKFKTQIAIALGRVSELNRLSIDDGVMTLGATATWQQIERFIAGKLPEYHAIVSRFGSPQVRAMGTIGGNIANASPIADSLPYHLVMEAQLELAGPDGRRRVPLCDFYQGYKQMDLADDELIVAVHTPMPAADELLKLVKVSRRRDMDISTMTAGLRFVMDGQTIRRAYVAMGGVGPMAIRLPQTEGFLGGKPMTQATMRKAGRLARSEITPISDVRGSADYRLQLAENVFLKAYHEWQPEAATA